MKVRDIVAIFFMALAANALWDAISSTPKAHAGGNWWRITRVDQGDSVCFVGENRYQVETFALSCFKK